MVKNKTKKNDHISVYDLTPQNNSIKFPHEVRGTDPGGSRGEMENVYDENAVHLCGKC